MHAYHAMTHNCVDVVTTPDTGLSAVANSGAANLMTVAAQRRQQLSASLLETALPARELSLVIAADRRAVDPAYSVHRWWARRPPALLRGLVLASALPAASTSEDFWRAYADDSHQLRGLTLLDPFVGGGSTLVEGARLGTDTVGTDVDPLAVEIVKYELEPASGIDIRAAGDMLLRHLRDRVGAHYPATDGREPLHYFFVADVRCTACGHAGPLYRSPVLVRDAGKHGGVVRDSCVTAFCPECFRLHHLQTLDAEGFECCGKVHSLTTGTFRGQLYHCPNCGRRSAHRGLATGTAPRRLVAVEETSISERRRLRAPTEADTAAIDAAARCLKAGRSWYPTARLSPTRQDDRPCSYGIERADQLYTERQLLTVSEAFQWVRGAELTPSVRKGLELALSNALVTNNRLCGYATDYGRLAPLFSIRGYSLPALAVELNPLHPVAGRGTITACIRRVAEAAARGVRRYTWSPVDGAVQARPFEFRPTEGTHELECRSAEEVPPRAKPLADICVFDPPYFDYIAYDELSEFNRSWFPNAALVGTPLYPPAEDGVEAFGDRFGTCIRQALAQLKLNRPFAFTYHSTNPAAWRAVGFALDAAGARITALWPVRSDGHMGHHSYDGNCEWDIVVVGRRLSETMDADLVTTVDRWVETMRPLEISDADRQNFQLALGMAQARFATVRGAAHEER